MTRRAPAQVSREATEPRLVSTLDGFDLWELRGVLVVMPAILPNDPPRLRTALERRRDASLAGQCACGSAVDTVQIAPRLADSTIAHQPDCDAGDERLSVLLRSRGAS